jgi:hypothetical protein
VARPLGMAVPHILFTLGPALLQVGNSWRTTDDIQPSWEGVMVCLDGSVGLSQFAGPGGWNDPDMLEVRRAGRAPSNLSRPSLLPAGHEPAAGLPVGGCLWAVGLEGVGLWGLPVGVCPWASACGGVPVGVFLLVCAGGRLPAGLCLRWSCLSVRACWLSLAALLWQHACGGMQQLRPAAALWCPVAHSCCCRLFLPGLIPPVRLAGLVVGVGGLVHLFNRRHTPLTALLVCIWKRACPLDFLPHRRGLSGPV